MADPTVGDVFDQLVMVNAKLDQIQTNTLPLAAGINQVKAAVQTGLQAAVDSIKILNTDVNKGFGATVEVLIAVAQINAETTKLIYHLTQQTDTMICNLEHITKNTCEILNQVTLQTPLQLGMSRDLELIRDIAQSAYPQAALDRQRREKLQGQMEACCPPPELSPPCRYEPCKAPPQAKEPMLPKLPPVEGKPTKEEQEKLAADVVRQLETHLPIRSFDEIKDKVKLSIAGQALNAEALAPYIAQGLFPIETKAELALKVSASVELARALVQGSIAASNNTQPQPVLTAFKQHLSDEPLAQGALGAQQGKGAIYGTVKLKGSK